MGQKYGLIAVHIHRYSMLQPVPVEMYIAGSPITGIPHGDPALITVGYGAVMLSDVSTFSELL